MYWADFHHWHHVIVLSKTPYLLLLGWISLRLRGSSWKAVGLERPSSWGWVLGWGLAAGAAMECVELFLTQPLLTHLLHKAPDLSELAALRGSVRNLAIALILSWTLAAVGEELAHRAYIMNRIAECIAFPRLRWPVALALSSIVFGLAHSDQGWTGMIENAIDGGLLAGLYLACGRNVWLPIVAHGVTDSIDSVLIFSGHYPAG